MDPGVGFSILIVIEFLDMDQELEANAGTWNASLTHRILYIS